MGELLALVLQEWQWLPSLSSGSEEASLLQTLARLLKSSHPEDLRAANKLIKEMVQEVWLGKRELGGHGLGGDGWAPKEDWFCDPMQAYGASAQTLAAAAERVLVLSSAIPWLLREMALGTFCGPSSAAALDLQQFHPWLASACPEMTWSFPLGWELCSG